MEEVPPADSEHLSRDGITAEERAIGLTSQIRRAVASIPTNIAEGRGRDGEAELGRFLNIAKGSTSEVEYLLQLAHDLNYIETKLHQPLTSQTIEIRKMLHGLMKSLHGH